MDTPELWLPIPVVAALLGERPQRIFGMMRRGRRNSIRTKVLPYRSPGKKSRTQPAPRKLVYLPDVERELTFRRERQVIRKMNRTKTAPATEPAPFQFDVSHFAPAKGAE